MKIDVKSVEFFDFEVIFTVDVEEIKERWVLLVRDFEIYDRTVWFWKTNLSFYDAHFDWKRYLICFSLMRLNSHLQCHLKFFILWMWNLILLHTHFLMHTLINTSNRRVMRRVIHVCIQSKILLKTHLVLRFSHFNSSMTWNLELWLFYSLRSLKFIVRIAFYWRAIWHSLRLELRVILSYWLLKWFLLAHKVWTLRNSWSWLCWAAYNGNKVRNCEVCGVLPVRSIHLRFEGGSIVI